MYKTAIVCKTAMFYFSMPRFRYQGINFHIERQTLLNFQNTSKSLTPFCSLPDVLKIVRRLIQEQTSLSLGFFVDFFLLEIEELEVSSLFSDGLN